jgi:hypothetical protein
MMTHVLTAAREASALRRAGSAASYLYYRTARADTD